MRQIAIILAALAAQGCVGPVVTGASADTVIIRHDPALTSAADLEPQARAECARFGRRAVFRGHTQAAPLGHRYARFECVS